MTKTTTASTQCRINKQQPPKTANKHVRRQRHGLKVILAGLLIIIIVGWTVLTEKMETVAVSNLRHETKNQQILSDSSTQHEDDTRMNRTSSTMNTGKRFAYFFYVTSNTYTCAAIQFIHHFTNELQMDSSRIDVVVLHTSRIASHLLRKLHQHQVRTVLVDAVNADAKDPTWRETLTKLRAFQDWGYDRVVFLDADAVPLVNLDHLFDLPPSPLYAPTAYWLEQPFFASTLLVIEPKETLFNDIIQWARDRGATAGFDMDILNSYFAKSVKHLPGVYTVLNSDFRRAPSAKTKLFDTTAELKRHTKVVHFSCKPDGSYGKPWNWKSHDLELLAGAGFDPLFGDLFVDYWRGEKTLCSK